MRVNLPVYFKDAESFIENIESANMCEYIYTAEFADLKNECEIALNGLLNKGLTNSFYYMFTQILKSDLAFKSTG